MAVIKILNQTIIICSIVRDAEKGLKSNIPVINQFCKSFKDYKIIVFENDSKDNTKLLLREWQQSAPFNIHIEMTDGYKASVIPDKHGLSANPFYCKKRIVRMVDLRNQYMDYLWSHGMTADYLMVVDLDVAKISLTGLFSSFENNIAWDAVTAFGYSLGPNLKRRYHDTYALTLLGDEDTPQTEKKIKELSNKYGNLKVTDRWKRVYSAFGGVAIYKFDAIKGLHYQLLDNNDDRVEVRCEHYSIYKQMAERGYDKVYINPAMVLKYQNLSLGIIGRHLMRKWENFKMNLR